MSKNKFYPDEDINDIIEAEEDAFFKGGVGSGKRGHTTNRPSQTGGKIPQAHEIKSGMKFNANGRTYTIVKVKGSQATYRADDGMEFTTEISTGLRQKVGRYKG